MGMLLLPHQANTERHEMTNLTATQVIEAIKADKSHSLNLAHNTITGAEQSKDPSKPKVWDVSFETTWGHKGVEMVRVEIEDGELEIW